MKNIILIIGITFLFASCADSQHALKPCLDGHVYGFWGGLWHGMIAPLAWIGSLFSDNISIWAINNNGGWYNFGFILGVGGLGFGSSSATRKR